MADEKTRAKAWRVFDHIVAKASKAEDSLPLWEPDANSDLQFVPDYETLKKLLGVPLALNAGTQSGVPALALDVWVSYELRRAGFDADQVWPRPTPPRIIAPGILKLISDLPKSVAKEVQSRISKKASISGATSASANILGKNYLKQVDVIISDWATGPELLVSTKRMDSSYGKNAANRVEESYGDAKNLRLRHPLAALGFAFGLRSDIFEKHSSTAEWIFDLLEKLGREEDAYHSTCLILMKYGGAASLEDDSDASPAPESVQPGAEDSADEEEIIDIPQSDVEKILAELPSVQILLKETPNKLLPGKFFTTLIGHVLDITPVHLHKEVRRRRSLAKIDQIIVEPS